MKLLVLLSEGAKGLAGSAPRETETRIERAFANAGAEASVHCLDAPTLLRQAKEAADADGKAP